MPEAAVATEVHEPASRSSASRGAVALDGEVRVDMFADREHLGVGKLVTRRESSMFVASQMAFAEDWPYAGDVGERDGNALGGLEC